MASIKRLGIDYIDLYYCHRRNHDTPIEEMMQTLADLVREGKIRGIGLSEVSAQTLRQAQTVHPVTAVQSEYSLWSREPEKVLLPTCAERNVNFIAYSPLGRAFLTGKLEANQFANNDFRQAIPRLQGDALNHNQELLANFTAFAQAWGHSNAALCLAWLLNKHPLVIPIPGTRREKYLMENAQAADIVLSPEQISTLDQLFSPENVHGNRYPDAGWAGIEPSV